jgi:hypothetical protein
MFTEIRKYCGLDPRCCSESWLRPQPKLRINALDRREMKNLRGTSIETSRHEHSGGVKR